LEQIQAILVHGMGRTLLAMLPMAVRLRTRRIQPALFGYISAFESWDRCVNRLEKFIAKHAGTKPFILVGHSLGTVLIRAVLPKLSRKPLTCFFLAPPTCACRAARKLAPHFLYRVLCGEMGQLLADPIFMNALPLPDEPAKIYAGTGGPVGRFSPFGTEPNDGVLAMREALLPGIPLLTVPALHSFIMNSRVIARDIVEMKKALMNNRHS